MQMKISNVDLDESIATEAWRTLAAPVFDINCGKTTEPLRGEIACSAFGSLLVGSTRFNAQTYRRNRQLVRRSGLDQYMIQLFMEGALHGETGKARFSVQAGDVCVFDLGHPLESVTSGGATLSLLVDRDYFERQITGRALHCRVLPAHAPTTRLLRDVLIGLCREAPMLTTESLETVQSATLEWLGVALADSGEVPSLPSPVLGSVLHDRVLDYIDRHLEDPNLNARLLCERFHVSRAHLYRAFAEYGGIATVIRERRLDKAQAMLQDPRYRSLGVASIAARCGFRAASPFIVAFKRRFDMPPSAMRKAASANASLGDGLLGLTSTFVRHALEYGMLNAPPSPESVAPSIAVGDNH